jgi:hypothetical protein
MPTSQLASYAHMPAYMPMGWVHTRVAALAFESPGNLPGPLPTQTISLFAFSDFDSTRVSSQHASSLPLLARCLVCAGTYTNKPGKDTCDPCPASECFYTGFCAAAVGVAAACMMAAGESLRAPYPPPVVCMQWPPGGCSRLAPLQATRDAGRATVRLRVARSGTGMRRVRGVRASSSGWLVMLRHSCITRRAHHTSS